MSRKEELSQLFKVIEKKFEVYMFNSVIKNNECALGIHDYKILDILGEEEKTMTQIAQKLDLTRGTVTVLVDNLIKLDYVKRQRYEEKDRRKVYVSLSNKGRDLYNLSKKKKKEFSKQISNKLTNIQRDKLFELLLIISKIDFK